jgi:alkanesulfonate monooxygenase SsuD/methylene tetrahydromethanopterin reductase-like flavin-dependent oxidoreductase (luciferase family)
VLLGGESQYTIARVIDFCDGWFPRASARFDPPEGIERLKEAADKAGRDMASLQVSVFRAPPDKQQLERYAQAGISRAILALPSGERDQVLRQLDDYAPLLS